MCKTRIATSQTCHGRFTPCLVARDEHDPCAHVREPLRGHFANARCPTRDDNHLTPHIFLTPTADRRESTQFCKSGTSSNVSPELAVNRWIRRSPKIAAGVQKPPGVAALSTSSARHAAAWPSILPVEP